MRFLLSVFVVVLLFSCGQTAEKKIQVKKEVAPKFVSVTPPFHLTDEAKGEYMREHYWDKFDFADTVMLKKMDSTSLFQAYYLYVMNFATPQDHQSIVNLLEKTSTSKLMFSYFYSMSEHIFNGPNSQMRNEDVYMSILKSRIESPLFDEWDKIAPKADLKMIMQNRVGHKANDFRYTLESGKSSMMSSIKADFVLIYINNPDCAMCSVITKELDKSPVINDMLKSGRLKILALYTDEELGLWRENRAHIPSRWINGYDKGCVIMESGIYDLKAVPAMYLLDSKKIVLLKDSVSVPHVEHIIGQE